MRLTKKQIAALEYFGLEFEKSDEPDAGWFAYDDKGEAKNNYPGSSCETIDDVVDWYESAQQRVQSDGLWICPQCGIENSVDLLECDGCETCRR